MVLPFLSFPNAMICPATCAPTSTTSSGSMVPVALMVATKSPRVIGAVLNVSPLAECACAYQTAPPPSTAIMTTATRIFAIALILHLEPNSFTGWIGRTKGIPQQRRGRRYFGSLLGREAGKHFG